MEDSRIPLQPNPAAPTGFRQSGRRTLLEALVVLVPLALLALSLRGCGDRVTGFVVARVPPTVDQTLGRTFADAQRTTYAAGGAVAPDDDARARRAFDDMVAALTPAERGALLSLRVTTVRDSTPNAFALPGGEVFVMTGLLERLRGDDDALRGVLAHELGHAVRRHGVRAIVRQSLLAVTLSALLGDVAGLSGTVVAMAGQLEGLRYGRAMEDEADAFGAALMARTGRSADGLARFLESLGSQPVPTVISTHPDPAERARVLRARGRR